MNKQMISSCKDDLPYWLALTFVEDIGPVTGKRLLSVFRSPRKVFEASFSELKDIEDIKAARARKIKGFDAWNRIEKEMRAIQRCSVSIVTFDDKRYPEHLRQLDDAPLLIYTKGDFHKKGHLRHRHSRLKKHE